MWQLDIDIDRTFTCLSVDFHYDAQTFVMRNHIMVINYSQDIYIYFL